MNVEQLSEYTGASERTIQRWMSDHGLPWGGTFRRRDINRVTFLKWAAPYRFVWEEITRPECIEELTIYHKAAMYDIGGSDS